MKIKEILHTCRIIAVVGLSSNPYRASHSVSRYMQAHGYRIIPVNPNEEMVLSELAYPRLEDVPERVEIVNVFRRSEYAPKIMASAIEIGARVVWFQEGVINASASAQGLKAGLDVVMDRCILKEHMAVQQGK